MTPLHTFLTRVAAQDDPRVVVRWTDESRIMPNPEGGFTVGRFARVVLTARLDGKPEQLTVDGLSLVELQEAIRAHDVDPLYRPDHITR